MRKLLVTTLAACSIAAASAPAIAQEVVNVSGSGQGPTYAAAYAQLESNLVGFSCQGRGGTPAGPIVITSENIAPNPGPAQYRLSGQMPCLLP